MLKYIVYACISNIMIIIFIIIILWITSFSVKCLKLLLCLENNTFLLLNQLGNTCFYLVLQYFLHVFTNVDYC